MAEFRQWRETDRVPLHEVVPLDTPYNLSIEGSSCLIVSQYLGAIWCIVPRYRGASWCEKTVQRNRVFLRWSH